MSMTEETASMYRRMGASDFEIREKMTPKLFPVYGDAQEEYIKGFEFAARRGKRLLRVKDLKRQSTRIREKRELFSL